MGIELLGLVLGVLGFQYIMWRESRENMYDKGKLFSYLWVAPLLFFLITKVSFFVMNTETFDVNVSLLWHMSGELEMYIASAGLLLFSLYYVYYAKWKLWPFLDDFRLGMAWIWLVQLVTMFFRGQVKFTVLPSMTIYIPLVALVLGVLVTSLVVKRYRSFSWYPSGKKGFLFCWFFGWYWAINALLSLVARPDDWVRPVGCIGVGFVFGLFLLYLGEIRVLQVFSRRKS